MNNLNQILLEGHLTRDPEIWKTKNEKTICKFSVASNRYLPKDDGEFSEDVSYFDITAWDLLAESCGEELKKGRGVRIIGRLKQDRWEQDGQKRSRVFIVAEHIVFKPVRKKTPDAPQEEVPF